MYFLVPNLVEILEIAFYSAIVYRAILLLRSNGVISIFISILTVTLLYSTANIFDLRLTTIILRGIKNNWILILVILFQNEIKTALSRFGQGDYYLPSLHKKEEETTYHPILAAVTSLSLRKTGALIVFENKRSLHEYLASGELLEAKISSKLILSIFQRNSILHDGAIIIKNRKIYAAKVYLPLSKNINYTQRYGTRHMAALGITEHSDAYVIVVSEETGKISFAQNGEIHSKLSIEELAQRLKDAS